MANCKHCSLSSGGRQKTKIIDSGSKYQIDAFSITDPPDVTQEAVGKPLVGLDFTIFLDLLRDAKVDLWSWKMVSMLRCRPTDYKNGPTRAPPLKRCQ